MIRTPQPVNAADVLHLRMVLHATPDAPSQARAALSRLGDTLAPETLERVKLVASELVTNSIRHAGLAAHDSIEFDVEVVDGRVRLAVSDPGPGFRPSRRVPRPGDAGGWGLVVVDRLAERWTVQGGCPTRVVCELV